ncbi:MAG: hypothetical protein ILP09_04470 [Oscillospiraceae bacterium]|nr:hypothetical protein [Oscillospiraceae bacterium]
MAHFKRLRKKQKGVVDKYCLGCRYLCDLTWGESPDGPNRYCCCDYICQTGKRRPCPAGSGCTVRSPLPRKTKKDAMPANTAKRR